jgi:hypothetical protein
MFAKWKRSKKLSATSKTENTSSDIVTILERLESVDYVKGEEPDRWHWCKNCTQYPLVVIKSRSNRPLSDLCDERKAKKTTTTVQHKDVTFSLKYSIPKSSLLPKPTSFPFAALDIWRTILNLHITGSCHLHHNKNGWIEESFNLSRYRRLQELAKSTASIFEPQC